MLPTGSAPNTSSPRNKVPGIRLVVSLLASVLLVAATIGVLHAMHGTANSPHMVSRLAATATTAATTRNATGTTMPTRSPIPAATSNSVQLIGNIRVTQNQDMRPACLDDTAPYTVVLLNVGNVTANWQVNIPTVPGLAMGIPTSGPHPLMSPNSASPNWATATPQGGSVAPEQKASFVITPLWQMPCGGTTYHASVQLSFPSGASQADIPLTYAGTGPARYSNVVLVSGNLNITQPCPVGGVAPSPFTFAIKNTGNYTAYPSFDSFTDTVGPNPWAAIPSVIDDPQEPVSTWLYAGETWTVTVAPRADVRCDGTIYHVYVNITNAQLTSQTMTFTDTFK